MRAFTRHVYGGGRNVRRSGNAARLSVPSGDAVARTVSFDGAAGLPALPGHAPAYPQVQAGPARRVNRKYSMAAAAAALIMLLLLLITAAHGYIAWQLAYPYVAPLESNPWEARNLAYEDFTLPAGSDGPAVNGWYIPASGDGKRTVVFSHGYGTNREEAWVPMYDLAALVNRLHYNVILFDYGYASAADRRPATGGIEESRQLLKAVRHAKLLGADEVIVWGFSMGAGTALQAALQTNDITAMILDSTFIADPDTLATNLAAHSPVPGFPRADLVQLFFPLWAGVRLDQIPAEQVKQTAYNIPLFIIHGTGDTKAPAAIAETIAANQHHPLSSAWIVPNGQHELLYRVHPMEYMHRAAAFLSQVHAESLRETEDAA